MKKILVDQCLQCWHCDDDTYHCRETGERIINPYVIPADCPLEDEPEQKPDLPESKGSETDMGTKIEPEFPSWTETESGVTEKSNPQYGIYHFLKHWYYRVVAPCLKSDGWIPVTERLPEDKTACLTCFKGSLVDFEMYLDGEFENGDDPNRTHWQPLPQPPQGEKGE